MGSDVLPMFVWFSGSIIGNVIVCATSVASSRFMDVGDVLCAGDVPHCCSDWCDNFLVTGMFESCCFGDSCWVSGTVLTFI